MTNNRVLLENYFMPGDLEQNIKAFIEHYNHQRYHESINNLIPADVYFGRDSQILEERRNIKTKTIQNHRLQHQDKELEPPINESAPCTKSFDDAHCSIFKFFDT